MISPIKSILKICDLRQQSEVLAGGAITNPEEVLSNLQGGQWQTHNNTVKNNMRSVNRCKVVRMRDICFLYVPELSLKTSTCTFPGHL